MRSAVGIQRERNWIADKLQCFSCVAAARMKGINLSRVISRFQCWDVKTVAVPFVLSPARSYDIWARSACSACRYKTVVDEQLHVNALPRLLLIHHPPGNRMWSRLAPSPKVRWKSNEEDANRERPDKQSLGDRLCY